MNLYFMRHGIAVDRAAGVPPRKSAILRWSLAPKQLRLIAR